MTCLNFEKTGSHPKKCPAEAVNVTMKVKKLQMITIPAMEESFEEAQLFIRQCLDAETAGDEIASETMLVFEALFHNLFEQEIDRKSTLKISFQKHLGNLMVLIGYEGKMLDLFVEEGDSVSPENQILHTYEDRLCHRYHGGFNSFQISVKRKHFFSLMSCAAGLACAVLIFLLLSCGVSKKTQYSLVANIVMPAEQLFGNMVFMISGPLTFFSLLKNLTSTYILSERYSFTQRLRRKSIMTSVSVMLIAVGMSFLLLSRLRDPAAASAEQHAAGTEIRELISGAVPPDIFEPFESMSPVPLIILALIVNYSFCSSGKYFMALKQAVDACYTIFSRILSLVLSLIPFIFAASLLQIFILREMDSLGIIMEGSLLILAGTSGVVIFYLVRLKAGGIRLLPFLRALPPLLLENGRINSSIDAVPFNIRYCVRHYGMNRKRLEKSMPVFAQTMFDGNCFLLMCISMFLAFCWGRNITWYDVLASAALVFFLSLGAPNQPGSVLIGTMILLEYHGLAHTTYMFIAVCFEVALGVVQNLINVGGDIVTVAVEERKSGSPQTRHPQEASGRAE